jgi:hypothetical protein
MNSNHVRIGIALLVLTVSSLSVGYLRAPKLRALAFWGWGGLAIILSSEALLILRVDWTTTFFTPMVWTGYLLLMDALVWSLRGESRLGSKPADFLALAFWSVPLWLIFEAYNLRLANWTYVGLPEAGFVRAIGYVWSFATIWPAIFETADFILALRVFTAGKGHPSSAPRASGAKTVSTAGAPLPIERSRLYSILGIGLLMLALPLVLPQRMGAYLFGLVWIGFVPMLDPLNQLWKGSSLLGKLSERDLSHVYSLLTAGWVCGILWEFWNYWAVAKWLYVFPIWQRSKIFEMPLPGYFGFPPFALECFVMYEFVRRLGDKVSAVGGPVRPAIHGP